MPKECGQSYSLLSHLCDGVYDRVMEHERNERTKHYSPSGLAVCRNVMRVILTEDLRPSLESILTTGIVQATTSFILLCVMQQTKQNNNFYIFGTVMF